MTLQTLFTNWPPFSSWEYPGDVNLENLERRVTRSIWHQVLGNCKADASAKPVPMDSHMAEDLLRWRRQSIYRMTITSSPARP